MSGKRGVFVLACAASSLALATAAQAQDATAALPQDDAQIGDIIVTAQKREQSINNVGMSINAASADTLAQRGVSNPEDLVKVVPGLVVTPSLIQTPVYTIRGIGFYDSTLASSPAVTVYVDEVPLVSPLMTLGASLDLERVEVLKGPQGTLFNQNSTGGAINYIAAKPTENLEAGGTFSLERFGKVDATGFVSGPITSNLRARLSGRTVQGGEWQYSLTRPGTSLAISASFSAGCCSTGRLQSG